MKHFPALVVAALGLMLTLAPFRARASNNDVCSGSLDLAQAEQKMLADNPDLAVARHDVDGAHADLTTAGERPNPTLSLSSADYDPRKGLGPGNAYNKPVDTILQLEQPIERGGKRGLRRAAAQHGIDAADATFADQKRQNLLQLRQSFYDLQLAAQKLTINREIFDLQADSLRAAQQRLAVGDIAATDVLRLQLAASSAENDLRQAEADLESAHVALAYLIGCKPESTFDGAGDLPAPALPPDDGVETGSRADVVAAAARSAQAQASLNLAKAQQVHDLSVGVQVEHYPNGVPGPSDGDLLLGFDVSVPIHLFHAYEGEIARAASDSAASRDSVKQTEAQAQAERAKARGDLAASARRALSYRETILPEAQKAAGSVEYAYHRGALPLLDLLDARRTLRGTRIDAASAASDYAKALAAWRAATEVYAPVSISNDALAPLRSAD